MVDQRKEVDDLIKAKILEILDRHDSGEGIYKVVAQEWMCLPEDAADDPGMRHAIRRSYNYEAMRLRLLILCIVLASVKADPVTREELQQELKKGVSPEFQGDRRDALLQLY
ncbi:hypothetical protein [Novosphingobium sp.]|uniref:hypothetical protein n=1 Tax=Novosphingobium sp. TaxID=1874826 RepID=UPI002FE0586D